MNANICQIRLDLEHFSVSGPEPLNHVCNTDQFLVSGGSPVPILCGNGHGEHSNYIQIFKVKLKYCPNFLRITNFLFQCTLTRVWATVIQLC